MLPCGKPPCLHSGVGGDIQGPAGNCAQLQRPLQQLGDAHLHRLPLRLIHPEDIAVLPGGGQRSFIVAERHAHNAAGVGTLFLISVEGEAHHGIHGKGGELHRLRLFFTAR